MTGKSGFDPKTGVCWQFCHPGESGLQWRTQHERTCPACSAPFEARQFTMFGRCRSGNRWFWTVSRYLLTRDGGDPLYGWEDTEAQAIAAAARVLLEEKTKPLLIAFFRASVASEMLKEVNKEKRRSGPAADGSDTAAVEYLYAHEYCWNDGYRCTCADLVGEEKVDYHAYQFQVIRKSRQRIYYSKKPQPVRPDRYLTGYRDLSDYGTGYLDRQKIEAEGSIWDHGGRHRLYLTRQHLLDDCLQHAASTTPDLHELKAAMAAAHPDHGGSNQAFIAARARHVAARRQARRAIPQ
jgi:hypothetical protein